MAQPWYIDGYDKNNFPYEIIRGIEDIANDCLEGTGLYVPSTAKARYSSVSNDSVIIANDGRISVFYLRKTSGDRSLNTSGNILVEPTYTIYWDNNQWIFHINDDLSIDDFINYSEAIARFNETFDELTF